MIRVTRLNGAPLVLNSDLIQFIESTPDTVVTLTTGEKLMVRETPDELIGLTRNYRRSLLETR